jgi:Asp-tRNA(Asn)/Glu-tRNA(Gln) amidotransferase A subunit family amidase
MIEPIINAITTTTYDRARERADRIPLDSTFAGVPVLIKGMIDVGGVRRTDGSRLWLTNVPKKNVAYINGVEAAGMNIIGMTNVPEFAQLGIVTNNSAFGLAAIHGTCRNRHWGRAAAPPLQSRRVSYRWPTGLTVADRTGFLPAQMACLG